MKVMSTQFYDATTSASQMEKIIHKIDNTLHSKLLSDLVSEKLKKERSMLAISVMNAKRTISEQNSFGI